MASFIIPIITGTLSTIGSLVILNIILRSTIKLGTTHHRIMASMSVFDIIASICMALSTLPKPSDTVFRNKVPMWGNKITCQIQGFLIVFGICGGSCLYICLTFYMVCKIKFRISDNVIRNKIEPYMLIAAITLALSGAIFCLEQDLINPSYFGTFCILAPYSEDCNDVSSIDAWSDCVSGDGAAIKPYERSLIITIIVVTIAVVLILVAMFLIIKTVCDQQKKQVSNTNAARENVIFVSESSTSENHEEQDNTTELRYSRVMVLQALLYISAFFITWIFMIVSILTKNTTPFVEISKEVLLPLQGFWNMIIFVYDKAYLVRQVEPCISWWQAVQNVFLCPNEIPMAFVTNLAIIEETTNARDPEMSEVSNHEEAPRSQQEITIKVEESSNHGDAVPSEMSDKDVLLLETQKIQQEHITDSFKGKPSGRTCSIGSGGSKLSSDQSSTEVIRNDGVDYLGTVNNQRFYLDSNGLRRTGAVEDRRKGRAGVQSTVSIESPSGIVGDDDSIGDFSSPSAAIFDLDNEIK